MKSIATRARGFARSGTTAGRAALAVFALLAATAAQAQVGLTTLQVGDLPVTLLYPTEQRTQRTAFGPFELDVARDAAPAAGRRPLIVMSHGTGGSWQADHTLAATFVRAGFVVAQPLHQGDNYLDTSRAGPDAWDTRPKEVIRVIDALEQDARWRAHVAVDRVGVHGMSAGGLTAIALAGGQWRTIDLVRHCLANDEADFGFCYNGLADPKAQAARRARFESARNVPELFLPAATKVVHGGAGASPDADVRMDRRIAAVTVAVPAAAVFSTESLARIRVPFGVVAAGNDTMLRPEFHSARLLRDCRACTPVAELHGGAHMDVLAPFPDSVARAVAGQHPRGGAREGAVTDADREAVFEKIVAFHRKALMD